MTKTIRKLLVATIAIAILLTYFRSCTYAHEYEYEYEYETEEDVTGEYAKKVEGIEPVKTSFKTTAYCPCSRCCGKSDGITASGEIATQWHTVASGGSYPFGTIIYIPALAEMPNEGWFIVEDRGVGDGSLDIFFDSHSEALQYGLQQQDAYVYYIP